MWLAVDKDKEEWAYDEIPSKGKELFYSSKGEHHILLPPGSIEKLIGRKIDWSDEPVEI